MMTLLLQIIDKGIIINQKGQWTVMCESMEIRM